MKNFRIEIRETLSAIVEVEASDLQEATQKVLNLYKKEEIILSAENHIDTTIDLLEFDSKEIDRVFSNFLLQKAEEMLSSLSLEELAKLGFGSLEQAQQSFLNEA